jgi:hypothetical protein
MSTCAGVSERAEGDGESAPHFCGEDTERGSRRIHGTIEGHTSDDPFVSRKEQVEMELLFLEDDFGPLLIRSTWPSALITHHRSISAHPLANAETCTCIGV